MCTYSDKFQSINTLPELYDFRESLRQDANKNSSTSSKGIDFERLELCQNAHYFIGRVEARIEYLESTGLSLDKILITTKE